MKKILIIDDDLTIGTTYKLKLVAEGFEVAVALNGNDGLTELETAPPDLVILDLMLPDISGLNLLAFIRKEENLRKTPVLLLSNHYLETGTSEEMAAGLIRSKVKAETPPSKVLQAINEMLRLNEPQAGPPPENPLQQAREKFCADIAEAITRMHGALQTVARSKGVAPEAFHVIKSCGDILTASAAELGLSRISHLTSALAGLAQQLGKPEAKSTASTSRTIAGAIDALDQLAQTGITAENLPAPLALVVEDDLVSQSIIRTALDRSRIRSIGTPTGELALALLENNRFDVIFLDVRLPGISGYEVCTALRKQPDHQSTPVVFITASNELEARTQSILRGANDYIAKPVSVPELAVKALTHLIKGAQQPDKKAPQPDASDKTGATQAGAELQGERPLRLVC